MKRLFIFIVIAVTFINNIQAQSKHSLAVSFSGYKNTSGKLYIALFNKEESFLKSSEAFLFQIINSEKDKTVCNFSNLEKGYYAIAVFHDINHNGKLDTNLLGVPNEYYGFSNDATGFMSGPSFSKAKFYLDADKSISIHLH